MKFNSNTIKTTLLPILSLCLLFVITSCSDDESRTGVLLSANTTGGDVTTKNGRTAATNDLVFNSGSITIREVVFDGENGNTSVTRTVPQVASIDYTTGTVSPEVFIEIPAGEYTSVNLGIELQDVNAIPAMVIDGTYTNSDDEIIPIRFEFNSGEVFEANAASVTIPAGTDVIGKITFDALEWFSPITATQLDNATQTDGVIVISENSNSGIFDIVAERVDVATQAVFE